MKSPEQAAAEWLAEYEENGPERAAGRYLDEWEAGIIPPRELLPDAIRTAWRAYTDPKTPTELREPLRIALDEMINDL